MDDNSFNSIDRLVEFGLGVAVANQMIATMNACIGGMRVPGGDNPMTSSRQLYYFVVDGKTQIGPCDETEIAEYIRRGTLLAETLMWRRGLSGWVMARALPEINKLFALNPPPIV